MYFSNMNTTGNNLKLKFIKVNEKKKYSKQFEGREFVIHADGFRDESVSDRYCGDGLIKFGRKHERIRN